MDITEPARSKRAPLHPNVRRSPYFAETERAGAIEYMVYNHMYMPIAYDRDPALDYRALTEAVTLYVDAYPGQAITGNALPGSAAVFNAFPLITLTAEGYDVTVLDNLSSGYRKNIDGLSRVEFVEGDVRDASLVDATAEGAEIIFQTS